MAIDRRFLLKAGLASAFLSAPLMGAAAAAEGAAPDMIALAGQLLAQNAGRIGKTDLVGIANYAVPSSRPRFHLVDMVNQKVSSFLVSHGRGSDPGHTGWLKRFSNEIGSNASSFGAYRTGAEYTGKHGRSMRLTGLDADNCNAETRAIVVHGAWYVSEAMVVQHGKLGRSEGCFAFSDADLANVLNRLGPDRLLYAGKF